MGWDYGVYPSSYYLKNVLWYLTSGNHNWFVPQDQEEVNFPTQ